MENPFESGHVRNYILFYAGIVLIMILFFFASSLFNDVKVVEKKVFHYETNATKTKNIQVEAEKPRRFKLLDKAY